MAFTSSMTGKDVQPSLLSDRRYLAIYLPTWPTDYLKRAEPSLTGPLALYERIKGGLRLAAVDRLAAAQMLYIGQNLADAHAMVPDLTAREIDLPLLEAAFGIFADWHSNASPLVAVMNDMNAYGDLVLDITGVSHLFGSELAMLRTMVLRLRQLGYAADGAVASTIGAAWAASHFAPNRVVAADQTGSLLDGLSVAALRLLPMQIAGLTQMGLKQIGQLRGRDRKGLQARFGASLIMRIDQAYGYLEERMTPRLPIAERYAERKFPDPIGLMDDVLMTTHDLGIQLGIRLESEGLGAQAFHLFLYRVDHKVMTLSVNAGSPTREPGHIARLFANRAERLQGEYDAGFGIDMIRLAASSVSPLEASQLGAFSRQDGTDLGRLYDRMSSRLGMFSVVRSAFVDTHIPERAVRLEPVIARSADNPASMPDPEQERPLRLLPMPEPIGITAEVPDGPPMAMTWRRVSYRFVKAEGPERLNAEWWRSGQRLVLVPPATPQELEELKKLGKTPPYIPNVPLFYTWNAVRDYYVAEDAGGRRFWLFRLGIYGVAPNPTWYLHGFFS
ncbi:DNA polymerase Y family protein [Devosia sp. UYZn731]|uniref:Y-family DNA polymerase n=1 Tax=Devosia sp. UYZn731 TaxID=3156345 RepID=UPI00339122C9